MTHRHPNDDWHSWRQSSKLGSSSKWSRTPEQYPWILQTGSSGMQPCCPDKHSGHSSSSSAWQSVNSRHRLISVEKVNHLHSLLAWQRSKQANSSVMVDTPTVTLSRHSPGWKHWLVKPVNVNLESIVVYPLWWSYLELKSSAAITLSTHANKLTMPLLCCNIFRLNWCSLVSQIQIKTAKSLAILFFQWPVSRFVVSKRIK